MQVGRGRRTGREAFDYRRVESPRSESDSVPSHASNRNSLGPSPFPCRRRVAWNHGASCFVARCCFAWKPSRGPESKVYFFVFKSSAPFSMISPSSELDAMMLSFGCWNKDEQSRTVSAKRTEKSTVQWEKSPTGSVGSDSYRLNIVGGGLRGNGAGA